MAQIYVVTAPLVVALVVVQLVIPALPEMFQFIVAAGTLAPLGAVKVAVKVRVELSTPPPVPVKLNVGVTGVIVKL